MVLSVSIPPIAAGMICAFRQCANTYPGWGAEAKVKPFLAGASFLLLFCEIEVNPRRDLVHPSPQESCAGETLNGFLYTGAARPFFPQGNP